MSDTVGSAAGSGRGTPQWIEVTTIGDLLLRSAERWSDRPALLFPDERVAYHALADRAIDVARGLRALGVGRGDAVGVLMPNCPAFAAAFFGASLLGAVVVPINARFKRKELAYVTANGRLVVVFVSDVIDEHVDFVDILYDALPGLETAPDTEALALANTPALRSVVMLGERRPAGLLDHASFRTRAATVDPSDVLIARARVRVADTAAMPYTSGTTSNPKGCLLSHEALVRDWLATGRRYDIREGDRIWDPLPLFHLAGLGPLLFTLAAGATFISAPHFDPAAALDQILDADVTHLYPSYPSITLGMLTHANATPAHFASVRAMLNVAPPETMRVMQDLVPHVAQINCYGLTESSGIVTVNDTADPLDERIATCGRPLAGLEVKVVDPDNRRDLRSDTQGEIAVRGYALTAGYHRDPDKTAATIDGDGWLYTGDLGTVDAEGRLTFVGRAKDMLKVGGENVAPSEIEAQISTHPAVRLVHVVGAGDDKYGEVPVAFVELLDGRAATGDELVNHCRGQIANFKLPRQVIFLTAGQWPMSATKVQKNRLRQWVQTGAVPPAQ